jgi:hypothetical protein
MTIAALIERYIDDLGGEDRLTRSKATSLKHIRKYLGATQIRDLDKVASRVMVYEEAARGAPA